MSRRDPAHRVCTARLLMRSWSPADALRVRDMLDVSDAHLRPWIPWMSEEPRTLDQTIEWLREREQRFLSGEDYRFGLFDLDQTAVIGEGMLSKRLGPDAREIGYLIDVRHIGRGYATEAAGALTRLALEVEGVERAELHCSPDNVGSVRVASKLGFEHEATHEAAFVDSEGRPQDAMVWVMRQARYACSKAATITARVLDAAGRELSLRGA